MEETSLIPRSWRDAALISVVPILAFLSNLIYKLIRPKQSKAEEARTVAEARSIDVSAAVMASDTVVKLLREMATATSNIDRLRSQRDFWQDKAGGEKARADLAEYELDKRIRIGGGNGKD